MTMFLNDRGIEQHAPKHPKTNLAHVVARCSTFSDNCRKSAINDKILAKARETRVKTVGVVMSIYSYNARNYGSFQFRRRRFTRNIAVSSIVVSSRTPHERPSQRHVTSLGQVAAVSVSSRPAPKWKASHNNCSTRSLHPGSAIASPYCHSNENCWTHIWFEKGVSTN